MMYRRSFLRPKWVVLFLILTLMHKNNSGAGSSLPGGGLCQLPCATSKIVQIQNVSISDLEARGSRKTTSVKILSLGQPDPHRARPPAD